MDERKKDILNLNEYAAKLRLRADEAHVCEAAPLARIPIVEKILDAARQLPVAAHVRPVMLRHRNDERRHGPL